MPISRRPNFSPDHYRRWFHSSNRRSVSVLAIPILGYWYDLIGLTHLLQSRTDEAIVWLEKARSANPTRPFIHADLAAAYGLKGDGKRAAVELAEARRLSVDPNTLFEHRAAGPLEKSPPRMSAP